MNNLIEFAKQNRTTTFFRELEIFKIRVAYRIMEYLIPDPCFQPKINQFTKDLMLRHEFEKAYEFILEELSLDGIQLPDSCYWQEIIQIESIELIKYLLPIYEQNIKDAKDKRRIELINELNKLDKENK
jgi:hypothetical protein